MLKFEVKNLGRVATAEVELAPLTILVGKNNTGKSYLATLIWALAKPALLTETGALKRKPAWFTGFVAPLVGDEPRRIKIGKAEIASTIALTERAFNRKAAEILSLVFAVDGFQNTKVKLRNGNEQEELEFGLEPFERPGLSGEDKEPRIAFYALMDGIKQVIYLLRREWMAENTAWIGDFLFQEMIGHCLFGSSWRAFRNDTYIPAARTGIMLALPTLVSQSLGAASQADVVGLPRPLTAFLSKMTERQVSRRSRPTPVRDRLKRELLRGQISPPREAVSEFRYTPEGLDMALPLYATSSMITELAPFLVALNNDPGTHHFIFEEPEAHLHLEAQREMARLIARLVAAGTPVTLTTHSDTFLQQINNLMVLAEHPHRQAMMEKLGYESEDLIPRDRVRAYEFCPNENGTLVQEVEKTDDGFVVATLNNTLLALAKETLTLRSGRNG